MAALWPWLTIAGVGALHGLSPANGWLLAAACGVHARDDARARRALRPLAAGQLAAMMVPAVAFSQGLSVDRALMRDLAWALLVGAAIWYALQRARSPTHVGTPAGHAGLALWSFVTASAQGAGLMLIPVLVPTCAGGAAASGPALGPSLAVALGAAGVHTAAMLLATGIAAMAACRGVAVITRLKGFIAAPKRATASD